MFQLRPYQENAVNAHLDFFEKGKANGISIIPTGAGKSIIIAETIRRLGEPTLVLQPSKEILEQNIAKYRSYGNEASIYSASFNSKVVSDVTYATIGSIIKKPELFKHFKYLIVDECFPAKQYVSTSDGKKQIGRLYNAYESGQPIPDVLSFNECTGCMEYKPVVVVKKIGFRPITILKLTGAFKIKVTNNHPFLTDKGWKTVDELHYGDCVLTSSNIPKSFALIPNNDQKEFLLGSMLGDGSIHPYRLKNITRFSFIHGESQKEYIEWKSSLLGLTVTKVESNGFSGKIAYRFNTKKMYCDDNIYSHEYIIENLTHKMLAISWMDDGSLGKLENYGRLYATATSPRLTSLLCEKLKSWGISCKVRATPSSSTGVDYHYITFTKDGVTKLTAMIAPYIHRSMLYKLPKNLHDKAGSYVWDKKFSKFGACVVLDKITTQDEEVYNLQVKDNETYVITGSKYDKDLKTSAPGIIVHNCHMVNPKQGMYSDFIKAIGETQVLGLTASPYRLSSNSFGSTLKFLTRTRPRVFQDVVYVIQNKELFDAGYLCPLTYHDIKGFDRKKLKPNSSGADFDEEHLKVYMDEIHFADRLVQVVNRLHEIRKALVVFTRFTKEAEFLKSRVAGVEVVTAQTPAKLRKELIDEWRKGNIKTLANVGILTTGVDYPELDTVVAARVTKSLAMWYQCLGRGIRIHPNKKDAWCVDMTDNTNYFGKIEDLYVGHDAKGLWQVSSNGKPLTNVILD